MLQEKGENQKEGIKIRNRNTDYRSIAYTKLININLKGHLSPLPPPFTPQSFSMDLWYHSQLSYIRRQVQVAKKEMKFPS
jgi:hypothetical protein